MRPIRFRQGSSASTRRSTRLAGRQRTLLIAGFALVALALVAAGTAVALRGRGAQHAVAAPAASTSVSETSSALSTASASTDTTMVEVPDLIGMGLAEAKIVLQAAGLVVKVSEDGSATATGSKPLVADQTPEAGTVSAAGSTVRLVVRLVAPSAASVATVTAKANPKAAGRVWVVCIDPGHQAHSNSTPEPIGPGATATKPSVSGGATGVSTGIPESEFALQISMNLKARLEARGIKVVMTRTTNDVNITNSQRAAIANRAHADLFVRVHCDGSTSSAASGVSTLYPADNRWTHAILTPSRAAAKFLQAAVVRSTGAVDRGAIQRSDLSGFNWAKVPSVLIEAGFLSNPVEDRLLASPHYQDKVASGVTSGILAYLATKGRP